MGPREATAVASCFNGFDEITLLRYFYKFIFTFIHKRSRQNHREGFRSWCTFTFCSRPLRYDRSHLALQVSSRMHA